MAYLIRPMIVTEAAALRGEIGLGLAGIYPIHHIVPPGSIRLSDSEELTVLRELANEEKAVSHDGGKTKPKRTWPQTKPWTSLRGCWLTDAKLSDVASIPTTE